MADKKAQLIIEGAAPVELPILTGTVGPDVIDVRGLTATGRFTFDPGFMSTASCESKITYIDGDNGILLHRGYPIEQLAEQVGLPRNLLPAAQRRTANRRTESRIRQSP